MWVGVYKKLGGNMKYIIACVISLGIVSTGMAQNSSDDNVSASGNKTSKEKYKNQINSGFYDRESRAEYPSVDPVKNDHLMPDRSLMDRMDEVVIKGSVKPDLNSESPSVDLNDHLTMGSSSNEKNELLQGLKQTEFGKACSGKRLENGGQSDMSSPKSFKMKDKNLQIERKANGVERVKFHNKNENFVYHQKKNGKSHYKYLSIEGRSVLLVEKKKSGAGYVILKSNNLENDVPIIFKDQAAFGVERDINSCMR
jgi:hypothetical protein